MVLTKQLRVEEAKRVIDEALSIVRHLSSDRADEEMQRNLAVITQLQADILTLRQVIDEDSDESQRTLKLHSDGHYREALEFSEQALSRFEQRGADFRDPDHFRHFLDLKRDRRDWLAN
jgi:hypothetical protein